MSDAVPLLIGVLLLVVLVVVVMRARAAWYRQTIRQRRGRAVEVLAVCPGEPPITIGSVPVDGTFDQKIEEVRSEAYMRVAALNSGKANRPWKVEEHAQ